MKVLSDYVQLNTKEVHQGLNINCYIHDIGLQTKGTLDFHLEQVCAVLEGLQENSLKCSSLKYDWANQESDFLGRWMTPTGVEHCCNQIEAVLKMGPPANKEQV